MTKYYYDCPIKAAYMTHTFGITTYVEFSYRGKVFDKYYIKDWNNRELPLNSEDKFYVNGNDPIFKVKEGDIRIERIINPIIFVAQVKYPNILEYVAVNHNSSYAIDTEKDRDRLAIHCRDGKPFFMPISEVENE